jgi:hypothetical protein
LSRCLIRTTRVKIFRLFQFLNPAKVCWQDELQVQEYGQAKWKSFKELLIPGIPPIGLL